MAEIKKIRNLNDLAKRMGCTATTVSMALRDSPQLSQELREKIKKLAGDNNFRPRNYTRRKSSGEKKRYSHLGPILLLHNDFYNELNPARDQTMPLAFQLFNQYGIEYSYLDISEVRKNPDLFRRNKCQAIAVSEAAPEFPSPWLLLSVRDRNIFVRRTRGRKVRFPWQPA